jgi:hypothetical protein
MNLYLLTQNVNNDYDTYDSCIVCAESEEDAKTITPNNSPFGGLYTSWAYSINDVKAELIGRAINQKRGIILASFNAG